MNKTFDLTEPSNRPPAHFEMFKPYWGTPLAKFAPNYSNIFSDNPYKDDENETKSKVTFPSVNRRKTSVEYNSVIDHDYWDLAALSVGVKIYNQKGNFRPSLYEGLQNMQLQFTPGIIKIQDIKYKGFINSLNSLPHKYGAAIFSNGFFYQGEWENGTF